MKLGARNRRITFERATITENAMGEEVRSWTDLTTAWGAVFVLSGKEARAAASEHASSTITVETLNTEALRDVTALDRLIYGAHVYDIKATEELGFRQGLRFTAVTTYRMAERRLAGALLGTSALSGSLTVHAPLVGAVAASGSLSGTLTVHAPLSGSVAGSGTLSGTLTVAEPFGPELIVNGDASDPSGAPWVFDQDTGAGITTISGGQFVATDPEGYEVGRLQQPIALANGETGRLVFTIVSGGGTGVIPFIGGALGTIRSAPGTYQEDIIAEAGGYFALDYSALGSATLVIDNISLKKVL